jgi:hypothetical protein
MDILNDENMDEKIENENNKKLNTLLTPMEFKQIEYNNNHDNMNENNQHMDDQEIEMSIEKEIENEQLIQQLTEMNDINMEDINIKLKNNNLLNNNNNVNLSTPIKRTSNSFAPIVKIRQRNSHEKQPLFISKEKMICSLASLSVSTNQKINELEIDEINNKNKKKLLSQCFSPELSLGPSTPTILNMNLNEKKNNIISKKKFNENSNSLKEFLKKKLSAEKKKEKKILLKKPKIIKLDEHGKPIKRKYVRKEKKILLKKPKIIKLDEHGKPIKKKYVRKEKESKIEIEDNISITNTDLNSECTSISNSESQISNQFIDDQAMEASICSTPSSSTSESNSEPSHSQHLCTPTQTDSIRSPQFDDNSDHDSNSDSDSDTDLNKNNIKKKNMDSPIPFPLSQYKESKYKNYIPKQPIKEKSVIFDEIHIENEKENENVNEIENENENKKEKKNVHIKRSRSILTPKKILNEQNKLITPTTENPRQKKIFKNNINDIDRDSDQNKDEEDEQNNTIKTHSIHLLNQKNNIN